VYSLSLSEPIGITFFGGIKINAMENTASFNVGDIFLQGFDSINKANILAGQVFGDFDYTIFNPVASPIYDPDGVDVGETNYPTAQSNFGLED
jgi:hypothetical protein